MGNLPTKAYVICGTPRTGSTLLCGLLKSTRIAGEPESYFRQADEQSWADRWQLARGAGGGYEYADYVRAAVAAGTTPNGVFGVRMMWGTPSEVVAKLAAVYLDQAHSDHGLLTRAFGPLRFVHVVREDTVAQAVSWVRAEQTQFWQDGDAVRSSLAPHFDADAITACVRTIDEHNAAWRAWFGARHQPHVVRYEELTADVNGVTRRLLDFLGLALPTDRTLEAGHRRQADEINRDWLARYRDRQA